MKNIITIIFLFLATTVAWGQSCSTFQGTDPGYVLTAGQLALSGTNSFTGAIGKRYKLNLIAGQSYTITGCSGFGSGTDLEFSIFNYASTILYQVDSDGCGTNDETYTFTAPYTGLYWLLLSENNCDLVCTFGCTGTITVACTTCPATAPAVPAIGQNNPVATDLCADAPLVQNLEGYGGSTSSAYTATGNSASLVSNFCGSIENNSFIKFIASATTAEFEFWIPSCSVGTSGVQFQVFSVTGTCATGTWTSVSNGCVNPTGGANSWGKFVATSLTVGNTYYLMFDGFAGNVCDYVVKGVSGLATCPLDPGTVSQVCNAAGTSYSVQIPFTGGGTKSYTITGGTNTGDNPSSVASGTMIIGPFSNNTGYTINISTADGICDYDFSIPTYSCPDYCAAINPVDNGTTTCGTPFNLSYVQQPVYEAIQTSCGMVNVSSPTDVNLTDDDSELDLPIGFTFNFFGTTYTTFNLHSNGIISFDAPGSDVNGNYLGYSAVTIPNGTTLPNNYIAGLYTDLNPTCGGTVTYKTIGTAPNRQLVVTWTNIEPYEGGCNAPDTEEVTFQIVLTEGTNAINTIVSTLPTTFSTGWSDPSNATQGVEAGDGAVAFTTPGRNWQSWTGITPTDLDCTTFQPVPLTVVFNGWYTGGAGGTLVGTANPQAVIPSATTTYTGSWTVNGRTCTKDVVVTISGGPTMTLGTATNVTACGGTDGTIPLTFTNVPNGTYTLSYQKDGTPATASIAVASNAATLTGLGAGSYTNFSISVSGCTATAAGPRTITAPSAPTTTGATICADGSGTLSSSTSCPSASTTGSLVVCSSIGGTFGASPGLTYNLNFSAIPAGATVTGVSYGASNGSSTDWASECDFNLSSPTITDGVDLDAGDCCGAPSSSGNFAFPAGSSSAFNGAPASGTWIIEWHDDGSPYTTNTLAANSNYCVTVTYAVTTPGTLQWYTAATGGTPVQTGSPFNPVGDAEVIAAGAPYSSLTNTNTPGTYTFYAACSGNPACRTATNFVINALPTITGTLSACIGATTTLIGSGTPDATTPWASASTSVATVSSAGVVTGVSAGTSVITYKNNNGCTQTATVTINALPTITGTLSACIGATTTLIGSGTPDATTPWASASTSVATVSSTGVVTGVSAGTSVITYKNNNGCTQTATVTINALPTITGTLSACIGATTTLIGSGTPDATTPWASASTSVATVSSTGVVTGVSAGTSVITYKNNNGCTQTATVTINALPTITGTLSACIGATTTLIGSGTPDATTPWASASTSVATVSSTGVVTGVSAGTSVITYKNNNGCTQTATVTINALPTITGTLSACIGATTTLIGSGTPDATTPWASASTSVATVSSTGVVTGVSAGTSVITYKNNNGCTQTATVTINALPTITGTLSACIGATTTLIGSGTPDATTPWASASTSVATVSSTGVVTGVSAGTSVITYKNNNGCTQTATVTINALPTITGTLSACIGATTTLIGSGTPDATTPWASASTSVATVSSTGVVTGVSAGTSVITYKNNNGCTQTATVTINALPTITGTLSACIGVTTTLIGSGTPDATTPWASASTSVATVSSTGVVTGVSAGTSVITYKNNNGCTQTATVTIDPLPTVNAGSDVAICNGGSAALSAAGSGGTGALSYSWTPAGTLTGASTATPTATPTSTTTYVVTVTDTKNCIETDNVQVTVNAAPTATAAATNVTCSGSVANADGKITISGFALGTDKYDYTTGATYSGSATYASGSTLIPAGGIIVSNLANPVVSQQYTVRIFSSSNSGCYIDRTVTLTNVNCTCPTITLAPTTAAACAGSASISFTQTGGAASGTWTIDSPVSGGGSIVAATGVYTPPASVASATSVVIKYSEPSPSNCFGTHTITINPIPSAPTVGTITQPTCSTATGSVALSGLPASGSWTVTASPGGATITGTGTTATFSSLTANTTYTFTVLNADGCTSVASTSATINPQPATPSAPTVGTITQPTCSTATGSVALSGLPASGSWTVTASPGGATITGTGTTATFSSLTANTTYTFTVLNADGCTSVASTSATINPQPATPSAPTVGTITQPTCSTATGSVALSGLPATGTWTVTASPGGATITGTGTTATFSGLAANTYTFTVTNSVSCTSAASTSATINAQPATPSISSTPTVCGGTTYSITVNATVASGTLEYSLDGGAYQSSNVFSGLASGSTHTVTVRTVGSTCTATATGITTTCACANPPSVAITQSTLSTCGTNAVTFNYTVANGPATVSSTGIGTLSTTTLANGTGTATYTPSAGDAGTTVTITATIADPDGVGLCTSSSDNVSVTVTANPTPSITSSGANLCSPGSRTLAATPSGGTFSVLSGPGSISGTTLTASGIGAIVVQYSVTVGGCTGTTTQTITTVACTRTITISDPCSCNNDATTLTNGTFGETVQIRGLFAGDVIDVVSITGLYVTPGGAAYDAASAEAGFLATQTSTDATLIGSHIDNVGYTLVVDVYDINSILVANDLTVSNKCAYPDPNFSTVPLSPICNGSSTAALILLPRTDLGMTNGTGVFSGTGVSVTTFTPAVAGLGIHNITLTYTGGIDVAGTDRDGDGDVDAQDNGVSPDGGTTPAFPGCIQPIVKTITVIDCCAPNQGTW